MLINFKNSRPQQFSFLFIVFLLLYFLVPENENSLLWRLPPLLKDIPLLINCHPAVVEYLGDDYPLYYNSLESANKKIKDIQLIKDTHEYLKNMNKSRFNIHTFIKEFEESNIYKSL